MAITIPPKASGIYKIVCLPTGKMYVGSAVDMRQRWYMHQHDLERRYGRVHHSIYLQRAWDKYGPDAFEVVVIEFILAPFLLEREQYWIDRLRAYDNRYGFNMRREASATHGPYRSPETIERFRALMTGRKRGPLAQTIRDKISAALRGRKIPPEIVAKGVANRSKWTVTDAVRMAHSKAWIVTDPDGNEYVVQNLKQFCQEQGLSYSSMHVVAQGRTKQHRGWKCRRAE